MHGSARQLLGAIKQTKNRERLLLATRQCRLAFTAFSATLWTQLFKAISYRLAHLAVFAKIIIMQFTYINLSNGIFSSSSAVLEEILFFTSKMAQNIATRN